MLLNYYIEKGNDDTKDATPRSVKSQGEQRIRVNDRTATGGWF